MGSPRETVPLEVTGLPVILAYIERMWGDELVARKDGICGRSYVPGREHWVELGRRMRRIGPPTL